MTGKPTYKDLEQKIRALEEELVKNKRVHEVLRESEEIYRTLMESTSAGIYLLQENKFIYINPAFEAITGYTLNELAGMPFWNFIHPDFREQVKERGIRRQKGEEPPERYEFKIIAKGGQDKWVDLSAASFINLNDKPTIMGSMFDITERKRAEEALKESYQKFSDIINFLPDATCVFDKDSKVIAWNRALEEMTGVRSEDMIGQGDYAYTVPFYGERRRHLLDLIDISDEELESKYQNIQRKGNTLSGETFTPALYGGKGAYVWATGAPLFDIQGNRVGAIESIRDITARRHTEEALLESEERFRLIADNVRAVIWMMDLSLAYKYISPYIKHNLGYAPDEYIAKPLNEVLTPASYELCMRLLAEELEEKKPDRDLSRSLTVEIEHIHKDGRIIPAETNMTFIRDAAGNAVGILGITSSDISERKSLALQLRQAQKMEAIGTLAGGIAHDFNNILSAVIGYAEMALSEPQVSDHLRRYLEQIYKAGIRAGDLVKQILTFSRQSDEKLYPLRISPIVKEVLKLIRASLPVTIEIYQVIQAETDTILGNPTQIHQILMNLCTNAAYAMGANKGILKIGLKTEEIKHDNILINQGLIPGKYVKLTVSDTGLGIDPASINKIFDPFFTTKKPGEGTGMGLSVVHGIVKSYGGAITVQSTMGKGTEFDVYFPLLVETKGDRQKEAKTHIAGGRERILFVDDEEALVSLGKYMLSGLGYQIVGRTSSLEALELFRARPDQFDLVITDMTMPNMTGLDLAQELMLIRPDMPVILCTGFSEHITPEMAKSLGLRDFIMKPIVLQQIAASVRCVLDKSKGIVKDKT